MLHIDILVGTIQYEKSFCTLLPKLCKKFQDMESDDLMIRFLQKMGDDLPTILSGVLKDIPESGKNELLCKIIQSYGFTMARELNCALAENCLGQYFRIGSVSAEAADGHICLTLSGTEVDYGGLLQSREVQEMLTGQLHSRLNRFLGAGPAGRMVHQSMNHAASLIEVLPGGGEQTLLFLLERAGLKKTLLRLMEDTLRKNGLYLQLQALQIRPDQQPVEKSAQCGNTAKLRLSRKLEEALLDSSVAFLRKAV